MNTQSATTSQSQSKSKSNISQPRYFLAKTEPSTYSIDDLESTTTTPWDGVHNYQAINYIKSWSVGDYVFIYHSMGQNAIVGLAQVISEPIKDVNDERNISWVATLKFIRKYQKSEQITLKEVKESNLFPDFALVRNSRLSVMECPPDFVQWASTKLDIV